MKKALLFLFVLVPLCSYSQKTNSGTDFWMAFMRNYDSSYSGKKDSLRLYISSTSRANVTVSIPGQSYSGSIVCPKDSVVVYLVPLYLGFIDAYETPVPKGIHITSDFPISVSAMNLLFATTDASIVLPTANIPPSTTYVVGTPNPVTNQIMLVATEDSTKVIITPTAATTTHPINTPFNVTLNKGELYQIGSGGNLTGTVVKVNSPKKLVVFTGDKCSNWPCGACDHQFEQVLPSDVLDTAYCIPPQFGHTLGYYIRLVPLDTVPTSIKVNGVVYNNLTRKNPLTINVKADSGYYASSTKLFHCYQFLKGAGCSGYINTSYGDPAILEIVSTKYFGEASLFSTVNSFNLQDHFISIVIKTTAKNNVYLDKTKIDSSEFKPFPYARSYSYAMIKINVGQHLVESSDGLLAYCYGVGFYESYLYLAGFSLPNFDLSFKDSALKYDCKNQKITMRFKAQSDKVLKSYTWYFGDNTTGTGDPVTHQFSPGVYNIKLVGESFGGKKDSVTRKIKIDWPTFDPVRDKLICGIDTIVFEEKNPFFTNFKWQDNSTNNYMKVWDDARIHVTATDTTGYCKFEDSGNVAKIDIFSNFVVDSLEKCWKYNKFHFKNTTSITTDQVLHTAWVFSWQTIWDTSQAIVHFPSPGKYKVYFDVYTTQANCKARYPIDVVVHPMPKVFAMKQHQDYCSNDKMFFWDSSQIVTGYIKQAKWVFDDGTSILSDSLKAYKSLPFDKVDQQVIRMYSHIAISDQGCADTATSTAVFVWPKPEVRFNIATPDTTKCLPSARWSYTSTTTVAQDTFALFWDAGNGQKSTNYFMKNIRYFKSGTYPVKLKAVSEFGCMDSLVRYVNVIDVPKAVFYVNDSIQCYKEHAFDFTDSSKVGPNGAFTYNWTLGNGNYSTAKNPQGIRYSDTGTRTVQLKISSQYDGCVDSISHHVHIVKNPVAKIVSNGDTQCLSGNKFTLKDQSAYFRPYKSTLWLAANLVSTDKDLVDFVIKDTGSYDYTLVTGDEEGCTDTVKRRLRVMPQPKLTLTIPDSLHCNADKRFVMYTNAVPGLTNYWRIDNIPVQTGVADSLVYTATAAGVHAVRLLKQTGSGCKDSIASLFQLLEPPKAAYSVNRDSQCLDINSFDFSDASTASDDQVSEWNYLVDNTPYTGKASISGITLSKDGLYHVSLAIKTREGCVDTARSDIRVWPLPGASITGDSVCLDDPASIKGIQTSGNSIDKWDWDLGDGNTASTQNVVHTYSNLNNYNLSLRVTDLNGCISAIVKPGAVLVYPLPDPSFDFTQHDYGINQVKLNYQPHLQTGYSYYWRFPNGTESFKDTPSMILNELLKGDISLRVTSQYGCIDSSSKYIYLYPDNFNVFIPSAISVNSDNLNDVFKLHGLPSANDYTMRIIDRWGGEIFVTHDVNKGWDGSYQGDYVPDGVYMYIISFKYIDGKRYQYQGTLTVLR